MSQQESSSVDRYTVDRYACPDVETLKSEKQKNDTKEDQIEERFQALNERLESIEYCLNTMINQNEGCSQVRSIKYWFSKLDRVQTAAVCLVPVFIVSVVFIIRPFTKEYTSRSDLNTFIPGCVFSGIIFFYWVYVALLHRKKSYTKIAEDTESV
ncbi:hypothetical protein CJU90_1033 [Yarrowia sp. C11]|nr:hypothetical protein CJU90_1033 [Yarrowia sp. C11]